MKQKVNTFKVGVALGAILPLITLYIIYLWLTDTLSFFEFINKIQRDGIESNIYIWTTIPSFVLFGFFYFKKYDQALKGVVLPTMIYTFALVLLNF